jgi:hypothetical protein
MKHGAKENMWMAYRNLREFLQAAGPTDMNSDSAKEAENSKKAQPK